MFDALAGATRFPGEGKLPIALDVTSIHPEQTVEGIVKFPL